VSPGPGNVPAEGLVVVLPDRALSFAGRRGGGLDGLLKLVKGLVFNSSQRCRCFSAWCVGSSGCRSRQGCDVGSGCGSLDVEGQLVGLIRVSWVGGDCKTAHFSHQLGRSGVL
jgi:hypothetical protein